MGEGWVRVVLVFYFFFMCLTLILTGVMGFC